MVNPTQKRMKSTWSMMKSGFNVPAAGLVATGMKHTKQMNTNVE
jgi:hypothetical protein